MNVYLYQPDGGHDDNIINFIIPHKTNAVIMYIFKLIISNDTVYRPDTMPPPPLPPDKTTLISGYESNRSISINLRALMSPWNNNSAAETRNAYVISCVRAPHIYCDLFVHNKYTSSLGFVVARTANETQIWHLLSVQKNVEAKYTRSIKGLRVHNNGGDDLFYPKELIVMSGNVSAHFYKNLQKCHVNLKDIKIIQILYPDICVDDHSVVQLE
jgi:hypothetical protein